ncbi:MAG: decaprenyl-phosphate phosphoribosyltransferase [Candidatus Omnitrophica bacterium]|nr:decaprenyl-phosphate phosphoribosyltransferase [Candidatus Omnitrophota bacterium]MBU0878536.1 decaprenyl-phosphate phosphoribosyltransferase [Candidatus Omnitrophota bacterium]MBU1133614.1 decaprenyl-phosphate phosphoribosyltransferase [Candidatus Omnitrophota bacterium]MBU1810389.1 decaprenyl-phosphate phosphoribosyltransferase [Candidatus Omnitrophota bacterium]
MKALILIWKSLRPRQWTKNLFIFAAVLFSQNIFNFPFLLKTIFPFFIFCFFSGCVYIINDLTDLEQDRHHPVKSQRPLASGKLKISYAIAALIILLPFLLGISYCLSHSFFWIVLIYFLLQLAYSFYLKDIVILDVFAIACGFVLRVVAGALVIDVEISSWLIICTILLALFLSLGKRRYELVALGEEASNHRNVLKKYSPYLLDQMISIVTAATVVAYCLYTVSEETIGKFGTRNLIFTVPFVLYGIFRYLYLIHQKNSGGSPENILVTDKPLMVGIFLWITVAGIILYG